MKKTGQLLKDARIAAGISLQEVSLHLKISIRILRALEDGDLSKLPSKTFLRGFVQSYSNFLRLDGNQILEVFQEEMGTTHPTMITKYVDAQEEAPKQYAVPIKVDERSISQPLPLATSVIGTETSRDEVAQPLAPALSVDQKTWSQSMKVGTALVFSAIAAVIFGVLKTIQKYEREAQVVKSPLPENMTAVTNRDLNPTLTPIVLPSPTLEGENAARSTLVTATPTPTLAATIIPGVVGVDGQSTVPAGNLGVVSATSSPQSSATPVPTSIPNSYVHEVIVEALDKVTINYSIDGKPSATVNLLPEKVHTFRGEKKITLTVSDGGAVNVIYNGKDKSVLGTLGKPIKLTFPE